MATRSNIGKLNSDNTVSYIYCHWDGYPSHNGTILQEHYNTPEQVDALLALGDMSSLEATIEGCKPYDEPGTEVATTTLFLFNKSHAQAIDYFYLFTDEGWKVSNGGEWSLLEIEDEVQPFAINQLVNGEVDIQTIIDSAPRFGDEEAE